ncbi:hypothetical protein ABTY96_04440 [Streptomyces sp. NPDC096057]|uniref:hypothetical protein n=1 Tax=Streptomyces sp. NPDC096057 TaxID=3155543 RepID=UPI00331EB4A4
MPTVVVEIHVPMLPTPDLPKCAYPYPWIEEVEDFLFILEDQGDAEVLDDGADDGVAYVFFITEVGEQELLAEASRVASLPGIPPGTVAVISSNDAEKFGLGWRVARHLPEA